MLDVLELHKTLVKEAIGSFEGTIDAWNAPQAQGFLAGHPIVYTRSTTTTTTSTSTPLVHNPHSAIPFEVLELVAEALLQEPKVTQNRSLPMRLLPHSIQKLWMTNILHIVTSILMDLMLTSSVSVHNGAMEMQWTYHPEKARAYYASLSKDKATIQRLIREALKEIDMETVQQLAAEQQKEEEPMNSFFFSLVAQDLYATGYKVTLIVFYIIFNWETECRMMGRSVRQKFVRPSSTRNDE